MQKYFHAHLASPDRLIYLEAVDLCCVTPQKTTQRARILVADPFRLDTRQANPAGNAKEAEMANGTVKWFNTIKGYGFIQPADGGRDVFVHASAVERSDLNMLAEGQTISYDVERDSRSGKESAVNLRAA